RFGRATVAPRLALDLARGIEIAFGPAFEFVDVREDEDRFVTVPQPGITENTFGQLVYGAAEAALTLQSIDHAPNPRQGFRWRTTADAHLNLEDRGDAYLTLASDLAFYASPSLTPQLTVAARAGGEHIAGTFPFFDAATLGGKDNLRGYRSTRFAGRTSAYQNLDVRVEVFDFGGYLGYGEAGVLGFLDNGRVWTDGEDSRTWHQGYGGGLWAHLFDAATLTATYALSPEARTFTLQLGFQF
ncbi:MAG: BamA/TamA family outer membrane protein, partial [Rhodothermales bacterium]|nr:BamA/TamA family outer membrane protein [Rhodothermales bacterium]